MGFAISRAKLLLFQEAVFPSMINECVELSKVGNNSLKLLLGCHVLFGKPKGECGARSPAGKQLVKN